MPENITENGNPYDLGDETAVADQKRIEFKFQPRTEVHPYDIFKLAKGILIVAASMYLVFALIRIFYNPKDCENSGITEVWEYSKVVLNSIVSLVVGLYFGSKHDSKNHKP